MEIALLLWPLGLLYAIYEDRGWESAVAFSSFLLLFIGGCILMGIDAFNGVSSPFDPDSKFRTMIPWFHLLLISLIAVTTKIVSLAYLLSKKKRAKLGEAN